MFVKKKTQESYKNCERITWDHFFLFFQKKKEMTLLIRQIRTFLNESPKKKVESPKEIRRKSLTVTISKEPPVIVYYERDTLEESFECIFDPLVSHDEEKDHPDLFKDEKKNELKPWQKPPYKQQSNNSFKNRFKSSFNFTASMFVHSHSNDNTNISQQSFC